jgi:RNA polymerase sigma-70 factor (ECF subfamily)
MDISDAQLMQAIAAGDPAAFQSFMSRHSKMVIQILYRLLREPADVEDVMQETFLQIWQKSNRYDGTKATPAGYLTLIARSRALDLLRRRKPDTPPDHVDPSFEYDISLGLIRDESVKRVRAALSQLPLDQRKVIRLAFLTGMTHEQIASMLKVPLGTVKTRIRLGLRRLKTLMPEDQIE